VPNYYTTSEASEVLGVNKKTIRRYVELGYLHRYKVLMSGHVYYLKSEVNRLAKPQRDDP